MRSFALQQARVTYDRQLAQIRASGKARILTVSSNDAVIPAEIPRTKRRGQLAHFTCRYFQICLCPKQPCFENRTLRNPVISGKKALSISRKSHLKRNFRKNTRLHRPWSYSSHLGVVCNAVEQSPKLQAAHKASRCPE